MSESKKEKAQKAEKTVVTPVTESVKADTSIPLPNSESPQLPVSAKRRPKRIVLSFGRILIALMVVSVIVAGSLYLLRRDKRSNNIAMHNKPVSHTAAIPEKPKTAQPVTLKTSDATYLQTPKLLDDQKIFADTSVLGQDCPASGYDPTTGQCKDPQSVDAGDIKYYQIGTLKNGSEVLAIVEPYYNGLGDSQTQLALEKDGQYKIIARYGTDAQYMSDFVSEYAKAFTGNVTIDTSDDITDLLVPDNVSVNGQEFSVSTLNGYGSFTLDGLSDIRGSYKSKADAQPTKIGTAGYDTIYKLVVKDDPAFQINEDYVTFGNLFSSFAYLKNSIIDTQPAGSDRSLKVTWQTGVDNSSSYFTAITGCGSSGYVVAKNVSTSQLVKVGVSADGQALYQLPAGSALTQELYTKDYKEAQDAGMITDAALKNLSVDDFLSDHAYFMFKDSLGEYVVQQRTDMFSGGECAKPVIYLYPQRTEHVSVQVGAQVKESNPFYTTGGWKDVLAQPSGQLTYQGEIYDSLYWEGEGFGAYPDITSGTIVKGSQAVATIKTQLKKQGLNAKEISDFMAYWQPKLPATPYVRLTWLSTAQMNVLAPLTISPRPQTLIRVFLDFEGLQESEKLAPQQFTTPARRGFTVVEWGGLARNGVQS